MSEAPERSKLHGKILYMLIPSRDSEESARFYQGVFNWNIRFTDEGISFDDAVDNVHGRFVEDMEPAEHPGFILYLMVDGADETEAAIVEHGGEVVDPADRDKFDVLGLFRDPTGNVFGFYEMKPGDG